MNERWVCKRCFADNEDTTSACHRCGLARGSEATATDAAEWAAASPDAGAPASGGGWGRWLRFWWIPAILIALAVGYFTSAQRDESGSISDAGVVSIEDLRVGDCFVFAEDQEEISQVDAIPCGEAHEYELYHLETLDRDGPYPNDTEWGVHIYDACTPAFEEYIGRSYETSVLEVVPFTPTEAGWDDGDRVVQCAVLDPTDSELTASLRNADR